MPASLVFRRPDDPRRVAVASNHVQILVDYLQRAPSSEWDPPLRSHELAQRLWDAVSDDDEDFELTTDDVDTIRWAMDRWVEEGTFEPDDWQELRHLTSGRGAEGSPESPA